MKHYSFYYGTDKNKPEQWILFDNRTPAKNIKHAIIQFHFSMILIKTYRSRRPEDLSWNLPTPKYIDTFVRRVIEYERKYNTDRGNTIVQYKKTRVYQTYEIVNRFRYG